MTFACPPVCVQDQLLGLHVQRHSDHLLWFPSECDNLKRVHARPMETWVRCLELDAVGRLEARVCSCMWEHLSICACGRRGKPLTLCLQSWYAQGCIRRWSTEFSSFYATNLGFAALLRMNWDPKAMETNGVRFLVIKTRNYLKDQIICSLLSCSCFIIPQCTQKSPKICIFSILLAIFKKFFCFFQCVAKFHRFIVPVDKSLITVFCGL